MTASTPKRLISYRVCWLAVCFLFLLPAGSFAEEDVQLLINNGGYIVRNHSGFLKFREQDLFIPASTLKVYTCLVALETLGKDYRFETHFYLDPENNLYIKGFGDPYLVSEAILEIGKYLAAINIRKINTIYLDDSNFALQGEIAGEEVTENPYDAINGALVVNFNALPLTITTDTKKVDGTEEEKLLISSGEEQTPYIPLMQEAAAILGAGKHRLNIETLAQPGHISPTLRYTGELFIAQFREAGITVEQGYLKGTVPQGLRPVYIYKGMKSLEEIIRACLKNSNNFIANQLFLTVGTKLYGLPASWQKSRRVYADYALDSLFLSPDHLFIFEGSGLSRKNRVSPVALLAILDVFKPYSNLLNNRSDILLKTGTMNGIYCYVGYFPDGDELAPFAILLNQTTNSRYKVMMALHAALELEETSGDRVN